MKIGETFRDLKNLLGFEKMMHKKRELMEKMVTLMLIAYAIGLLLGETLRDHFFPEGSPKRKAFSGLFILLKFKLDLPPSKLRTLSAIALESFSNIVRTYV
jgi:hypothetical protein